MKALIALVGSNSLMMIGLKSLLNEIMPMAEFVIFPCARKMIESSSTVGKNAPSHSNGEKTVCESHCGMSFFHYFITPQAFVEAPDYFAHHRNQTIVLSDGDNEQAVPLSFRRLNTQLPKEELLKQLLLMHQQGHANYSHYPAFIKKQIKDSLPPNAQSLTPREIEVLRLLAKGLINKQISDKLSISVNTVITHRKNIMQKLHSQSLSKLVIYAVQHGVINASDIE